MTDTATLDAAEQIARLQPQFDPRFRVSYPIFISKTWIAPADGWAVIRAMGAGGSGARSQYNAAASGCYTGGYAAAWGCKIVRVTKGQQIAITIGAGGVGVAGGTSPTNGNAGGSTTVTISGVTYTVPGGPGGVYAAVNVAPNVPNGPALPSGWDCGAASVRPGYVTTPSLYRGGGAGVDILMQGNNATTSDSSGQATGGGGTGGPSIGFLGGGALPNGASASGLLAASSTPGIVFDATKREWGISFYGGSGGGQGMNGGNGGGGGEGGNGGNGGGGGAEGGKGGLGAGGGASMSSTASNTSGPGGHGYVHIELFPDTPK